MVCLAGIADFIPSPDCFISRLFAGCPRGDALRICTAAAYS